MRGGGFGGSSGPPERSQQSGSWSVRAGSPGGGGSGGPERSRRAVPIRPEGPEHPEQLLKTGAGSVEKKPAGCPFKASFRAAGEKLVAVLLGASSRDVWREIGGLSVQARFRTFKNMLENNKQ